MTHERPTERLRVDVPTLEPDPAFLGMLAHLSAGSQAATPRSTRSAGFRMVVATGSVAVIATATWAAGVPTGGGVPHSPAESPSRIGPSGTPSPGDVGTPHSDVATPGSPLSPGLPGSSTSAEHATDPERGGGDKGERKGPRPPAGKSDKAPKGGKSGGPGKGADNGKKSSATKGPRQPPAVGSGGGPPSADPSPGRPQDPQPEGLDDVGDVGSDVLSEVLKDGGKGKPDDADRRRATTH
ncbi:hypothetical protein ACJ5H2_06165 [Nocardioides sp. R1-1]|uniref:hypothetical protein n=1 Tax=Nocardioides sp. R1-1 TaxID=3383502 RepID=UPI0038D07D18